MKKFITFVLASLGLLPACGHKAYDNADVEEFARLAGQSDVALLDVRTAKEFGEGHIPGALNIDVKANGFIEKAVAQLPKDKTIAVYCRSGRRSADAAGQLADKGYKVVNLKGGILAWQEAKKAVTTDDYEVDEFTTKSGKTVKFHALMHACIRIEYDGREFEIDPVRKLGDRTVDYASMLKADYIFVTHEHGDHFDQEAIKTLTSDKTRLITNRRCADMLGYGEVMANGDKTVIDGITVEAVPAYNITEGRTQFHPKGRDNGFILTIDGLRVYIAGDTEDIPEMSAITDIDVAFLPCNQPYTMTTSQLVNAAKTIKPKVVFPYHYGQTDVTTLPAQLKDEGIDARIRHYE